MIGALDPQTRVELDRALAHLTALDGVVGCLVATRDGAIVARALVDDGRARSLAATTAAICGRLSEIADGLGIGAVQGVLTETSTHTLQFMPVGGIVLVVVGARAQNIRAIRETMRAVATAVAAHPALVHRPG